MTPNPYVPPRAAPEASRAIRLFTAPAVALHVFLLPPFGALLAVLNYRRLRDPRGAWRAAAMFGLSALGLVYFGFSARSPGQLAVVQVARAVLAVAAFHDQRAIVQAHFAAGGRKGRWAFVWLALVPVLAVWLLLAPPVAPP